MLLKCPTCAEECTVAEESLDSASCPSCGCRLWSRSTPALNSEAETVVKPTVVRIDDDIARLLHNGDVPCRVGRYYLKSAIARGGFSRVYLATDEELGRDVAIKLPRPERYANRQDLAAVLDEARTAAKLKHPGIVTIYDVGYLAEGTPFIAMEYVPGQTLRDLLAKGRLPYPRCAELLASIAESVHYAHGQGLVHRDLKPGNVLLDERGQPKIVDFGLAVHESRQSRLDGDISGTPSYMAPEQVRGEAHRLDGRTDIWSLGVIFYEMLSGRRPFQGEQDRVFDEILNREPKPPRQIDDRIPRELEEVCLRCLSKSVSGRFSTSLDVAEALRTWLQTRLADGPATPAQDIGKSINPNIATASVDQSRRRRTAVITASAVGLLAVAVGIGILKQLGLFAGKVAGTTEGGSGAVAAPGEAGSSSSDKSDGNEKVALEPPSRRVFEPGRWNELLDRSPEVLVWNKVAPDSIWTWKPEAHDLLVTSNYSAALTLGSTTSPDFRLEVRIAKPTWLGSAGLFWGAQEIPAAEGEMLPDGKPVNKKVRCQTLFLFSYLEEGKVEHRLVRDVLDFWLPRAGRWPAVSRKQYLSADVLPPNAPEIVLEMSVLAGQVQRVRWNGQSIPALCDGPQNPPAPVPLVSAGRFGAFEEGGTAIFRDAKYHPAATPTP